MKKNLSKSEFSYNIKRQNKIVPTNEALNKKIIDSPIGFKNTQNIPIASRNSPPSPNSKVSNKKMLFGAFSALFLGCSLGLLLISVQSQSPTAFQESKTITSPHTK